MWSSGLVLGTAWQLTLCGRGGKKQNRKLSHLVWFFFCYIFGGQIDKIAQTHRKKRLVIPFKLEEPQSGASARATFDSQLNLCRVRVRARNGLANFLAN